MPTTTELWLDSTTSPTVYPARIHGAACALFGVSHDGRRSPFSAWPPVDEGSHLYWRLGWVGGQRRDVTATEVTFGPSRHGVLERRVHEVSYADLANTARAHRRATVEVITPLYFSRGDRDHPLPDPVLVMQSLMGRWDDYAPAGLAVPVQVSRELLATIYLVSMEAGRTVAGPVGRTTTQTGFVGTVELGLTRRADERVASVFSALMRFAEMSGVGAQTGHGFGAVRVVRLGRAGGRGPASRYRSSS